jgi:Transposase DDE domain
MARQHASVCLGWNIANSALATTARSTATARLANGNSACRGASRQVTPNGSSPRLGQLRTTFDHDAIPFLPRETVKQWPKDSRAGKKSPGVQPHTGPTLMRACTLLPDEPVSMHQVVNAHWDAQQAHCPQGHPSVSWWSGRDVSGDPVIRICFDRATCRVCPTRRACISARAAPHQLTVRLQTYHKAIQAVRRHQEMPEFTGQYALRAGVESSLSQGIRRFDLRRSRYLG